MQSGTYTIKTICHKGLVRNDNEDYFSVSDFNGHAVDADRDGNKSSVVAGEAFDTNSPLLVVVADGMGGLDFGEAASIIATKSIKKHFHQRWAEGQEVFSNEVLQEAFDIANAAINERIKLEGPEHRIGTTMLVAIFYGGKLYLSWLGDTRAYELRGESIHQLSKDHSFVQELADEGAIRQDETFGHHQSNIITKYLGNPKENFAIGYREFEISENSTYLFSTDGLHDLVSEKNILEVLSKKGEDIGSLYSLAMDNGGKDNITLVSIKTES